MPEKFKQFVEVKASNGQTIFIRKTTVLWLLQKGGCISTDSLFRVRCEQPYANSVSSTNTEIIKSITIVDHQVKINKPQDIPMSSAVTEYESDREMY